MRARIRRRGGGRGSFRFSLSLLLTLIPLQRGGGGGKAFGEYATTFPLIRARWRIKATSLSLPLSLSLSLSLGLYVFSIKKSGYYPVFSPSSLFQANAENIFRLSPPLSLFLNTLQRGKIAGVMETS